MKRWIIALVPLVAIGALVGWRLRLNAAESRRTVESRRARTGAAATVTLATVGRRDIVTTLQAVGSIESPQSVRIAPKVSARILSISVREGDPVRSGQALAVLDSREVEADVRQQQANLAAARERLSQAQIVEGSTGVGITSQIEAQRAALRGAESDEREARDSYDAQVAAAESTVLDMQSRVASAEASVSGAQASLRSAEANLANAMSRLNRAERLLDRGFASAQAVDDARTAVQVQEGLASAARSQLSAAQAQKASAEAQRTAAERQLAVTKTRGRAAIESSAARVEQTRAALRLAEANESQRRAYGANLAALRSAVAAAEAAVRNAQARRTEMVLRTPTDGFVTARYADPGSMATPGTAVLMVMDTRRLWVSFPVPEDVSRKIALGDAVRVRLDAAPDRELSCRIIQVNAASDPLSRQVVVRAELPNTPFAKPGMFARVALVTDRLTQAVVVPREAVQRGPSGAYVTVVDESMTAHRRPVVTGAQDPQGIAIVSGLSVGEKIVTLSASPIQDGRKVRPAGAGRGRERKSRPE